MEGHPIEGLMLTAMNSIENMIDVNTIIGEPIETSNNIVIIPISKVTFGFAAGGSEFKGETIDEYTKKDKDEKVQYRLPFGGGSGATVSINPIAFLVVEQGKVKLLPVNHSSCLDKIIDYIPDVFEKISKMNGTFKDNNNEEENRKNNSQKNIEKIPETEEKLEYIPKRIKKEEDTAKELNEIYEDEFEYQDDD